MKLYIEKLLDDYEELKEYQMLGNRNNLMVEHEAQALLTIRYKSFHMIVARLLYQSKQERPDILEVVGFLCTSMKKPTIHDAKKLVNL
jgi:hypothetical protein